ncbi:MAG TPA: hypothetical protein VH372_10695 [Actinospica sp.]|nr:hypothetical protein [Actinospica sp.]
MSAKLGFTTGLAVGLLAGSRAGRGLYDRAAAAATAVVNNPRVRRGASTALHKTGEASSSVAGAAARKVKQRAHNDDTDAEPGAGASAAGACHSGGGFRALREGIAGLGHHKHDGHDGHKGHAGQRDGHDWGISRLNGGTRRHEAAGTTASGTRRYDSRDAAVPTPFVQDKPKNGPDGLGSS